MVYNKTDFEKHINSLKPDGFQVKTSFGSTRFIKKEKFRTITIGIGYNEYFPHSAIIKGISADIYIEEVENKLTPLYKKHGITESSQSTVCKVFQDLEGINYNIFEIEINDDESFNRVKSEVQKIINTGTFPFIEKYNSLKSIAELLAFKKAEEIVPYIQGAKLLPKTVLILKLAGHPHFKEKLFEFHGILKLYSQKKSTYLSYLNLFNDLFEEDLKSD